MAIKFEVTRQPDEYEPRYERVWRLLAKTPKNKKAIRVFLDGRNPGTVLNMLRRYLKEDKALGKKYSVASKGEKDKGAIVVWLHKNSR